MTQFLVATNHHRPLPPSTTTRCFSPTNYRPPFSNSIRFPNAAFGCTSMRSPYRTTSSSGSRVVICMAKERRVKMVAKQIQREISDMLITDQVLQYAVLPEAALGADRYLSSLTTVSDVEVSNDLQFVKVYVSVFGDERGKEVAIAGLKSKAKYVRAQLGKRMKLRLTPEIRFIEDDSLERGSRVIAILDKLKNKEKAAENPTDDQSLSDLNDDDQSKSSGVNDDDEDWEDEDPDEEIIYVK